jgi:hypothetical protein
MIAVGVLDPAPVVFDNAHEHLAHIGANYRSRRSDRCPHVRGVIATVGAMASCRDPNVLGQATSLPQLVRQILAQGYSRELQLRGISVRDRAPTARVRFSVLSMRDSVSSKRSAAQHFDAGRSGGDAADDRNRGISVFADAYGQSLGLLRRAGDQQPAGRLRVGQQMA